MASFKFSAGKASVTGWDTLSHKQVTDLLFNIADRIYESEGIDELKHKLSSLRHDLARSAAVSAELRRKARELVERYNTLDPSQRTTPQGGGTPVPPPAPPTSPTPTSPSTPTSPTTPPPAPPASDLAGRVTALERRVDGHDRRHEQAEANLGELNGAVGIVRNPDGTWVPTPDGQLDRNSRVQQHLGYARDRDGNVTFADRSASEGFSMGLFVLCVAIGMGAGFLLGLFSLWLNFGLAGPIGGIFIGAILGAGVGLWLGHRKGRNNDNDN